MNQLWEMPAAMLAMGYLIGSIPFGVLLTRMAGAGDLRQICAPVAKDSLPPH